MQRLEKAAACLQLGLHGAPLMRGFLMRPGAAVVEIRPHDFTGAPTEWENLGPK